MKKLIPILLLILAIDFQTPTFQVQNRPAIKVASEDRQENWTEFDWTSGEAEGSCVHASMMMLFRYQGRDDLATFWGESYSTGEWHPGLIAKLQKNRISYKSTFQQNDVEFLKWAIDNEYGCIVTTKIDNYGDHMILLVHLDNSEAAIIDPNNPNVIKWIDREKFLKTWFLSYSWATTVLLKTPRIP